MMPLWTLMGSSWKARALPEPWNRALRLRLTADPTKRYDRSGSPPTRDCWSRTVIEPMGELAHEFVEAIEELGCFIVHQLGQNAMLVEQLYPAMAFFFEHLEVAIQHVIGGAIA